MDADRFAFRKIGNVMRTGVEPIEMLVDDWVPRLAIVWISSEPEAGKTWLCLWLAARAMDAGLSVAYIDAELGEAEIVRRLLLLGCSADLVDTHLDYLDFPSWQMTDEKAWDAICAERQWDIVVFETASDFLADAGMSENEGLDVTEWVKAFPERVRVHGGTAIVSDHVRKDGITNGYAVGSRAKKAKTKVGFEVRVVQSYDSDHAGIIQVDRTKNTLSAPVPKTRKLAIGPIDGFGTFDIRDATSANQTTALEQAPIVVMADVLTAALYDGGHINPASAISQNILIGLVSGNRSLKIEAAQYAATSPVYPVVSFAHGANGIRYYATARTNRLQAVPTNTGTGSELLGTSSEEPVPGTSISSGTGTDWREPIERHEA